MPSSSAKLEPAAMSREEEEDISDADEDRKVNASRVLGSREKFSTPSARPHPAMTPGVASGKPSSWWNSWHKKEDGGLVPKNGKSHSVTDYLGRQRESGRSSSLNSKYFRESGGPFDRDEDHKDHGDHGRMAATRIDLDQFAFTGVRKLSPTQPPRQQTGTSSKLPLKPFQRPRVATSSQDASHDSQPEGPHAKSARLSTNSGRGVNSSRHSPEDGLQVAFDRRPPEVCLSNRSPVISVGEQGLSQEQVQQKKQSKSRVNFVEDLEFEDGDCSLVQNNHPSSNKVVKFQANGSNKLPVRAQQQKDPSRGAPKELPSSWIPMRSNPGVSASRAQQQQDPATEDSKGLPSSWIPVRSDPGAAKARIKRFFLSSSKPPSPGANSRSSKGRRPGKGSQLEDAWEDDTDTLDDTLEDEDCLDSGGGKMRGAACPRQSPMKSRLRKRKAPEHGHDESAEAFDANSMEDDQALLDDVHQALRDEAAGSAQRMDGRHEGTGHEGDGQRRRRNALILHDEDEDEDEDIQVVGQKSNKNKTRASVHPNGGSMGDAISLADDEESLSDPGMEDALDSGALEDMDPVTVALKKCEAIAATLQKQLAEGVGDMRPDIEKAPREGGREESRQCFAAVDDAGAKLVSQDDVAEACGYTVQLKPYQLVGVNFLVLLSRQGVGGAILADEMGLGKTVQAISFLAVLAHLDKDCGPHLVVAPASLLENWQRELRRWCPGLKVVLLHGSERAEIRSMLEGAMGFGRGSKRGRRGDDGAVRETGFGGLPFNVMLTCYSLFERDSQMQKDDRKFLRKVDFSCVLMDEAHLLKDRNSQRTRRLRAVASKARHRLMLTGTPLQNDLTELWCLLELLHPSIFGTGESNEQALVEQLRDPERKDELIARMKAILAPFVLRRVKADVMRQLSAKIQKVELVRLLEGQQKLYAEGLETCRSALKQSAAAGPAKRGRKPKGGSSSVGGGSELQSPDISSLIPKKQIASLFTHLRKVANHPLLIRHRFTDEVVSDLAPLLYRMGAFGFECTVERVVEELRSYSDFDIHRLCEAHSGAESSSARALRPHLLSRGDFLQSAKCQALAVLLPRLKEEGHRPLIFSQWTSVLDILEQVLGLLGLNFVRLDGSTQVVERQELVDQFNGDTGIFAFLLSTRAGGQGLNLTGADTVILHDVDFNPQMDKQAEDRAHRIGQTRPVTIIRLVCKDTVDENILKIAERKLSLDAALLSTSTPVAVAAEESSSMAAILTSLFQDALPESR